MLLLYAVRQLDQLKYTGAKVAHRMLMKLTHGEGEIGRERKGRGKV